MHSIKILALAVLSLTVKISHAHNRVAPAKQEEPDLFGRLPDALKMKIFDDIVKMSGSPHDLGEVIYQFANLSKKFKKKIDPKKFLLLARYSTLKIQLIKHAYPDSNWQRI